MYEMLYDILQWVIIVIATGAFGLFTKYIFKKFKIVRYAFKNSKFLKRLIKSFVRETLLETEMLTEIQVAMVSEVIDSTIDFMVDYAEDDKLSKEEIKLYVDNLLKHFAVNDVPERDKVLDIVSSVLENIYKFNF